MIVLAALLGWQTVRLSDEQAAHAKTHLACEAGKRQAADQLAALTADARRKENDLRAAADNTRRKSDEAIAAIARQRDAIAQRLRNQAKPAAAQLPGAPAPAGAEEVAPRGDGPELPGPIRAGLDEAARAEVIRVELLGCYEAYDAAQKSQQAP
ncbi:MAG TPA: hypothetical protein VK305_04385 [Roseateles sp.]|nr:hypothetical protein [Roseateles sp.]